MQLLKLKTVLVAMLLSTVTTLFAQPNNQLTKEVQASYQLSESDAVSLKNQYGDINVTVWDKNEIKVDVLITVNSGSNKKSTELLNGIEIKHAKTNNQVFFTTEIEDKKNNWRGNQKRKIDYTIYLPANNKLKIDNLYGNVTLPNYAGATELVVLYGNLTAGTLTNNNNEIRVTYGNLSLQSATNADVDATYSGCDIKTLVGTSSLNLVYAKNVNLGITQATGNTKIRASYAGNIQLNITEGVDAAFKIETSYGNIKNNNKAVNTQQSNTETQEGWGNYSKNFNGKIGAGNASIKITGSYTDVTLQ
jgi:hypothetical protein